MLDLDESVRPNLVEAFDVRLMRIGNRHAQHLEVLSLVVAHLQPADRPGPDATTREGRLVDQEEGVRVIAVTAPGLAHEAVVEVVVNRGSEDAIETKDARPLVPLVLVPTS